MKKFLFLAFMSLLAISVSAQKKSKTTTNAEPAVVLKNQQDSASYAYGIVLGNSLKRQVKSLEAYNTEMMIKAMMAMVKGDTNLLMNLEQAGIVSSQYNKEISRKANAGAIKAGEDYLAANKARPGVQVTASGLQYEVLSSPNPNAAMPNTSSKVKVHYHGTLIDGTVFDSSVQRGTPAEFGVTQVIKGWTEGLQLMHLGDKFKFHIPYNLAYGEQDRGAQIKAFSTLIFEVELLEIK
jgi:FKBP-type peptidyl-prolyl cis-trans isomerase FklB